MLRLFLYMKFYTYILYSSALDSFYIGYTSMEIDERIKKHNTNQKGFTGRTKDWMCVYFEEYETKKEAYAREREIKAKKSRKYIENLIVG